MNNTINFARPVGGLAPWLALGFGVLALAMAVILVGLFVSAQELRAARPALEKQLQELRNRQSEATQVALPGEAKMAALKSRVAVMRDLAGNASSLSLLLQRLEAQLPEHAYLLELRYKKQPVAHIEALAEARDVEPLTRFLLKLEQDKYFGEVLLARQAQRTSGGVKWIQFDIRLKEAR